MPAPIRITFFTPEYGWLPVSLKHEDFTLEFHASDVVNDPVEELYDTLLKLRDHKPGVITWWMEPGAFFFRFEEKDQQYLLTITETDDLDEDVPEERKTTKIISGSYQEIIEPFKNVLLEFGKNTWEERHWPCNLDPIKLRLLAAEGKV